MKSKLHVIIGTYTRDVDSGEPTGSGGIYLCEFDPAAGTMRQLCTASEAENPSYLALSPSGDLLYAVQESLEGAAIAAYRVKGDSLAYLGRREMEGSAMCYIGVSHSGRFVMAANYMSGEVLTCPVRPDGSVDAPKSFIPHSGHGINPQRQEGPHSHAIIQDPSGQFLIAADLGVDQLFVYRCGADGTLAPHPDQPTVQLPPGSGPRHLTFHPSGRLLYVITELSCEVLAYRYNGDGTLSFLQSIPAFDGVLPEGNLAAAIQISGDGNSLYVSNRGLNTIVRFRLNPDTGLLDERACFPCGGRWPRSFCLAGDGILCANQESNTITLLPTGGASSGMEPRICLTIPSPTFILPC